MINEKSNIEQEIYTRLLKDDKLRCTCDEQVREESFFQANGHYHHCMLYQVARAIHMSCDMMRSERATQVLDNIINIYGRKNYTLHTHVFVLNTDGKYYCNCGVQFGKDNSGD